MKKSIKIAIAAALTTVALAGFYAAYKESKGEVDFTDNAIARKLSKSYQKTEEAAENAWKKTENFFVQNAE